VPTTLLVPIVVAVATSGALALAALGGWPGEIGVSATGFCEALGAGIIKQFANTFSNLGFVVAALLIGWQAARDQRHPAASLVRLTRRNRMTTTTFYPAFYAGVSAFLGPGSAAMHASTTNWGQLVDVFSMYVWAVWMCTFGWVRLRDGSERDFLRVYVPAMAVLGALHFSSRVPISSNLLFGSLVVGIAVFEVLIWLKRADLQMQPLWGIGALAVFLVAFAIWLPSHTGGPLCDPDSLLQGHAIWHLLSAVAVWLLYQQARTQHTVAR
jgi:hypothetical protein